MCLDIWCLDPTKVVSYFARLLTKTFVVIKSWYNCYGFVMQWRILKNEWHQTSITQHVEIKVWRKIKYKAHINFREQNIYSIILINTTSPLFVIFTTSSHRRLEWYERLECSRSSRYPSNFPWGQLILSFCSDLPSQSAAGTLVVPYAQLLLFSSLSLLSHPPASNPLIHIWVHIHVSRTNLPC